MPSLSLRLGNTLYDVYQSYCKTYSENMTKSQAFQYLLIKYLERPELYSALDVRELREPMEHSITIAVPDKLQHELAAISEQKNFKISEVIRMAIYQELIVNANSK